MVANCKECGILEREHQMECARAHLNVECERQTEEKNELLDALRLIHDVCTHMCKGCNDCPMFSLDVGCYVKAYDPSDWIIKDEANGPWRAYK